MKDHIKQLLGRLENGAASESDMKEVDRLLESGELALEDIESIVEMEEQIMQMDAPEPSTALNRRFYEVLSAEKRRSASNIWNNLFSDSSLMPRFAMACLLLIAGFTAGYFLKAPATTTQNDQITVLSQQLSDLQEMMMLSLLEKGSATERLKAVNLTQEMTEASQKVTSALITTLNEDENVNVRLAALDALKPYARDPYVREALIQSISKQESPLVQVSLAELMVALQEKSAVKEFEKIMESEKTPAEVKRKIRESIGTII